MKGQKKEELHLEMIAKKMDEIVLSVLKEKQIIGFEKSYKFAIAIRQLKQLLTNEIMECLMELQGNRLGFKTDKDNEGGYPETVVKNCLIEAVLTGVQPYGNQFNIIAGGMYITKEGFGYLLSEYEGLRYIIVPDLPRIKEESSAIVMTISWNINNNGWEKQQLDIPIRINKYMGTEAIIGSATRKARAWLYNTIAKSEISDGDVIDNDAPKTIPLLQKTEPIYSIEQTNNDKEKMRILEHICNAKTQSDLNLVIEFIDIYNLEVEFTSKLKELENE